jgi:hypothetical protein
MAKGKGSGKHYTSKGERQSSISTRNTDSGRRMLNKIAALRNGKDVVFTMENPNKNETNKRFIKVRVNGKAWYERYKGIDRKKKINFDED